MQRQFILRLLVALSLLAVVLIIALFAYYHFTGRGGAGAYGSNLSKDELMKEYLDYTGKGDFFKAFKAINAASQKDPENMPLLQKAAEAAILASKKNEANKMYSKIWESGVRDPKVLFALVATSILPKFEQRKWTLELIAQIKQQSLREKLYALYYFQLEDYEKAEEYFEWLLEHDPHPAIYEYFARNYLGLRRPVEAIAILEEAKKKGYLGDGGEIILANLYAVQGKITQEEELFKWYEQNYQLSDYVILSHAIILFANNQPEAAEKYFKQIEHPARLSRTEVVAPEEIITKLQNDPELKTLFDRLSPRTREAVTADKNDIFEISLFSEYLAQDFNRIAAEDSKNSEEFAVELQRLHKLFAAEIGQLGENNLAHQARLFLAMIYFAKQDKSGIGDLLVLASGNNRFYEGERSFFNYYLERLENKPEAQAYLSQAQEVLGKNVVVLLALANEQSFLGDYPAAIKYYSLAAKENRIVGSGSYLLENLAQALADDQKYLACFELIRRMHNKRQISKRTLMLLRDVAYPAGFPEVSDGAQRVLEKKYGMTGDIVLGRAELRLREGDAQAALEVFERLLAQGIEPTYEARINSVMAEAMLQLRQFDGVLDIVDEKGIDATYKARALYGLGKHEEALEIFEEADTNPAEKGQWRVEYGLLLALKGQEEEAAMQFDKAIAENPELVRAYVELASLLLKHQQYLPAREYASKALEIVPGLIRPKLVIANVDIVGGNNAAAEIMLGMVLEKYPNNLDALFLLSRSLQNQGEQEEALQTIDRCLQLKPMYPLFLQQKIDILTGMNRLQEAVKTAGLGIETGVDTALFEHAQIMLLLEDGKLEQAASALQAATAIAQSDKMILESQLLQARGEYKKAIDLLKPFATSPKIEYRVLELIILDPELNSDAAAYVRENLGKFKLSPQALLVLGMQAEAEQKNELAVLIYKQGLKELPTEEHLLNNYIWVALKLEKVDKEELLAQALTAVSTYPDNPLILDTATAAFNRFKEYDKSIEALRKNPSLFRLDPGLYLRLGDAWLGKGELVQAEKAYAKVEESAQSSQELKDEAAQRLKELQTP